MWTARSVHPPLLWSCLNGWSRPCLVAGLQSPSGQQLWLGYVLGRSDVPWLETERFRLTACQATVEHTLPQGAPAPASC